MHSIQSKPKVAVPSFLMIVAIAMSFALSSCGGQSVQTRVVEHPKAETKPYVIGKDDQLDVVVWKEEQLSGNVTVAGDGTITIPLAGRVPAAGHTTDEVQEEIRHRLQAYTHEPTVTVRVIDPASRVIYVLGEVHSPGQFKLRSGEVLSQALAQAGGLNDYADGSKVRIVRHQADKDTEIIVNYDRIRDGKDMAADIELDSGDTITVP